MTLGGDRAVWAEAPPETGAGLLRIVPAVVPDASRAVARVRGVLARSGRVVTVQLSCAASRGRFCRGTVRLAGAAAAVPYIAPGQERGGRAADARRARRAHAAARRAAVRTTAVASSAGAGTTATRLVLRR